MRLCKTCDVPLYDEGEYCSAQCEHKTYKLCPVCQKPLGETRLAHATHVAMGKVVCSSDCHALEYALQGELDLEPDFYLQP